MKVFYIDFVSKDFIGVIKKIDFQVKAFNENKIDVVSFRKKDLAFNYYKKELQSFGLKRKIIKFLSLIFQSFKIFAYKKYEKGDVIYIRYIRYILGSLPFQIFFNNLKKRGIKIVIEIPTYPYDGEINKKNFLFKLDVASRVKLKNYIDKIITYSQDKEIWGIPCINISNGIDLDEVKLINKVKNNDNKIVFTSVSNCSFWHGIDRFLYSLIEYKKNDSENNIIFNIVGKGTETSKLKKIVENNPLLKDCVIFYGFKSGKELDEIYNQTDIGVGSLGRFRSGITELKSLKNREYCAKGIPMIYSENDLDLDKKNFVFKVENNEKIININEILEWYKNLKVSSENIRKEAEFFSWNFQIKRIIDNL